MLKNVFNGRRKGTQHENNRDEIQNRLRFVVSSRGAAHRHLSVLILEARQVDLDKLLDKPGDMLLVLWRDG